MTKQIEYKALSSELDDIVAKLQSGDIDVDEAIELYKRGAVIIKELEKYLTSAENSITKVKASLQE